MRSRILEKDKRFVRVSGLFFSGSRLNLNSMICSMRFTEISKRGSFSIRSKDYHVNETFSRSDFLICLGDYPIFNECIFSVLLKYWNAAWKLYSHLDFEVMGKDISDSTMWQYTIPIFLHFSRKMTRKNIFDHRFLSWPI